MSNICAENKTYGIYIHIPFCKSKCKYCAFVSTPDLSIEKLYIKALLSEITNSELAGSAVDTIYIGGGTPSCLYRGALTDIFNVVYSNFKVVGNSEISVECNPESVNGDFVSECVECGINRFSMGLQSSSDDILRAIGRVHDYNGFIKAIKLLSAKTDNISSDIILGLPNQNKADIFKSVSTISEYCAHASVYALNVEEGTPLYNSGYAPDDDLTAELYDYAFERLSLNGFSRYEVSNFARDGKQSKHNKKYWECLPYIGFGVAAHGYDGDFTRFVHPDDIAEYIEKPSTKPMPLTEKDRYNEYVMLRLRTEEGINKENFYNRFGFSFEERDSETLRRLVENGYLTLCDNYIRISPNYMFVMNGIIEELMLD